MVICLACQDTTREEHNGHQDKADDTGNARVWRRSIPHANPFVRNPLGKTKKRTYGEAMKHITFGDKSLLVGDQAADLMIEYASLLSSNGDSDTVTLHAVGPDGNEADATFLLDTGTPLMIETTNSSMPEPDNSDAVSYMQEKMMLLSSPPPVRPHNETMPDNYEDLNL